MQQKSVDRHRYQLRLWRRHRIRRRTNGNIEAGQLGDTIVDLFKNLSDEQREALALQVLEKWVEEPTSVEKDLAKVELLRKYRCKLGGYIHNKKYQTDEEILRCYDFQKELNNVKTSKELMIREVTDQLNKFFKDKVETVVKDSDRVNAALEVALEQATADF
ncbi:MAG: hypothetical protein ACXAEN_16620, partial [Candidatus Thorarchaeota archaeon]